jgi:hypothetical protein
MTRFVVASAFVLLVARTISAQPADTGQSLASKVVDPSAGLSSITLQDKITFTRWGIDDGENEVDVQPVLPWTSFGHLNIFRVRVPFITDNVPGATGLDAVQAFNLTIFPRGGGVKLLFGALFQFAPDRGQQAGNFGIGPVAGVVKSRHGWTYGLLNQNLFGSRIASSQLQPILAKTLSPKVSMALGDLQLAYDWEGGRWTSLPIGAQLNYISGIGKQPIRLFVNPQYNFRNLTGGSQLSTTLGLALLLLK